MLIPDITASNPGIQGLPVCVLWQYWRLFASTVALVKQLVGNTGGGVGVVVVDAVVSDVVDDEAPVTEADVVDVADDVARVEEVVVVGTIMGLGVMHRP